MWEQLYAGDKSAIGRDLRISGQPFKIVGVMPAGFDFIDPEVRLWMPIAFTAEEKTQHHSNNWTYIGRLKPGATLEQAQAQVDALNNENLERFPQFKEILINAGFHTVVKPLQDILTEGVKKTLYLLWGGAILVLLIGGLNIANLALTRLSLRRKEMATRIALGAGRLQLMRQLILENVGLALAGRSGRNCSWSWVVAYAQCSGTGTYAACGRSSHGWDGHFRFARAVGGSRNVCGTVSAGERFEDRDQRCAA